jgi:signal transduction histidine kinase
VAQNLAIETDPEAIRARLGLILEQAQRIDRIVRGLLRFSRAGTGSSLDQVENFPVSEAVAEAISLVQLGREAKQVRCENRCGAGLKIEGNRPQLVQVLVNLLTNACDASHPGDIVEVDAKLLEGARIGLSVSDHGAGMSEAVRHRIFEPFFTTKQTGEGTGLGLSLAYSIVREHAGRMDVESVPGTGTTVLVELPLHQSGPLHRSDSHRERVEA